VRDANHNRTAGNDLSPIQPDWVPPNCRFEVDDFEEDWLFSQPFDFIHGRELEGSIRDHDRLFKQAFDHLKPQGYFEMQSMEVKFFSDDDTHLTASNCLMFNNMLGDASASFGKSIHTVNTWEERMKRAGFKNVVSEVYKIPMNSWPKDAKLKNLGWFMLGNVLQSLESYGLVLFTHVLGWQRHELEVLLAGVRNEIKDRSVHMYSRAHFIYGQKVVE